MSTNWSYFDKFEDIMDTFLPSYGEGETLANQAVTAISKLVYKWYNDGDVYDNTYGLEGWANDLSSYANWLYRYIPESQEILDRIDKANTESDYEDLILRPLADKFLNHDYLNYLNTFAEKQGSIYDCDGPFEFRDYDEEEEEDEWYEDEDYNEDYGDEEY